jgi:hypothetical protein
MDRRPKRVRENMMVVRGEQWPWIIYDWDLMASADP